MRYMICHISVTYKTSVRNFCWFGLSNKDLVNYKLDDENQTFQSSDQRKTSFIGVEPFLFNEEPGGTLNSFNEE